MQLLPLIVMGVILLTALVILFVNQTVKTIVRKGVTTASASLPVVLLLFVFSFVFNLINLSLASKVQTPDTQMTPLMIGVGFLFVFLTIFMQAGSMGYVRDRIKEGKASLANFTASGSKNYVRILLLSLLIALIIGVFVLLAALLVALLGQKMQTLSMGLAIVVAAIGIYAVILFFFAPYIAIADGKPVMTSMKESIAFVRKNILQVLGISIVLISIGFVIGIGLGFLVGFTAKVIPTAQSQILFAFLSSLVNSFLGLVVTSSFMHFYLSQSAGTAQSA